MNSSGRFIRVFGQKGEGTMRPPSAIHIADQYVYVSDCDEHRHRIAVYQTSGHFVTSFGRHGHGEGELHYVYFITSCANGFIYVSKYFELIYCFKFMYMLCTCCILMIQSKL